MCMCVGHCYLIRALNKEEDIFEGSRVGRPGLCVNLGAQSALFLDILSYLSGRVKEREGLAQ